MECPGASQAAGTHTDLLRDMHASSDCSISASRQHKQDGAWWMRSPSPQVSSACSIHCPARDTGHITSVALPFTQTS